MESTELIAMKYVLIAPVIIVASDLEASGYASRNLKETFTCLKK
jgi:hypothetical protein